MVTFVTCQFPHFKKNGGTIGLAMDNTLITWEKKKSSNKKINENEHKDKEMWKKSRSIF
jgi:hypothetical protein